VRGRNSGFPEGLAASAAVAEDPGGVSRLTRRAAATAGRAVAASSLSLTPPDAVTRC